MVFWNKLNFTPDRYQADARKSRNGIAAPILSRARALRHLPYAKNFLGGDNNDHALAGGTLQGWFAPDITGDVRKGLGGWSKDELVQYLKTGATNGRWPRGRWRRR